MYAEESAELFQNGFKLKNFDKQVYIRMFDDELNWESNRRKARGIKRNFEDIGNQVHKRFINWYDERKNNRKELFKKRLSLKKLNLILSNYRRSFLYIITL